jgi:hypothetical protein
MSIHGHAYSAVGALIFIKKKNPDLAGPGEETNEWPLEGSYNEKSEAHGREIPS